MQGYVGEREKKHWTLKKNKHIHGEMIKLE